MYLKDYFGKIKRPIKRFGKVFCRHPKEHLGWILFKFPQSIKHHNSIIQGEYKNVLVFLRDVSFVVIEEYQVDAIAEKKDEAKWYLEQEEAPEITDRVQREAHERLVETYNEVLRF